MKQKQAILSVINAHIEDQRDRRLSDLLPDVLNGIGAKIVESATLTDQPSRFAFIRARLGTKLWITSYYSTGFIHVVSIEQLAGFGHIEMVSATSELFLTIFKAIIEKYVEP